MSEIERIYPKELISVIKVANPRSWLGIMGHHTWKPAIPKEGVFYAPRINRYHKIVFGPNGLGYSALIGDNAGMIEVGKRWIYQLPGAHCRGKNYEYIGLGVVGDYDQYYLPAHLYNVFKECCIVLQEYFRIPVVNIEPHSKYSIKTCPGKYFQLEKLRMELTGRTWCKSRCPEFPRTETEGP